jgi:hypothetical protein
MKIHWPDTSESFQAALKLSTRILGTCESFALFIFEMVDLFILSGLKPIMMEFVLHILNSCMQIDRTDFIRKNASKSKGAVQIQH